MPSVGPLELAIVLIIALVVFGPKKLPELGSSLGRGMREFKDSISGESPRSDDEPDRDPGDPGERSKALTAADYVDVEVDDPEASAVPLAERG